MLIILKCIGADKQNITRLGTEINYIQPNYIFFFFITNRSCGKTDQSRWRIIFFNLNYKTQLQSRLSILAYNGRRQLEKL
jgi:hypothetical protein